MSSYFQGDAIFWVEVDRITPNPYQPRRDFDEAKLKDLAESIRQYGILQPLTVTRSEVHTPEGGMSVNYELIAGERRLRAAKLAGLLQVPVIIRANADDARVKLELAIIENLQREDLNPVDRAKAFDRLVTEFKFKHNQIAQKVGKSREYVSNSVRLLALPEEILGALGEGKISEGHARSLLMLDGRKEEQATLFKEIMLKKLTVRESEAISRRIAFDRIRKKDRTFDPEIIEMEQKLTESLGTRVHIEQKEKGGRVVIDFFAEDDLRVILEHLEGRKDGKISQPLPALVPVGTVVPAVSLSPPIVPPSSEAKTLDSPREPGLEHPLDDRSKEEKSDDTDLYSVKNFSL